MSEHIVPVRSYYAVYMLLMVLLVATVGAAFIDMGPFNLAVSMAIAVTKAVFILLIFMHVKQSEPMVWVYSVAAFAFLAILIMLTLGDYLSRGMVPIPGK